MRTLLKILPVLFPITMTLLVIIFPNPDDLREALWGYDGQTEIVQAGVKIDQSVTDPDDLLTFEDFSRIGCAERLEGASPFVLRDCARIIAAAVVEVANYEQATGAETTTAERLMLAATEVCRAAWVASPGLAIDTENPACATSTLRLASLD